MSKTAGRFALVAALVGLAASVAAAYVHYRLLRDPGYLSFCDINATVTCTQVYLSRYGSLRGIPVALFGALWFGAAALLVGVGLGGPGPVRESVPAYLFVLSTAGLAAVLYLGYASFFVLKAVCLLCLTTYAAVIGLFLVSGAATSTPMTTLPRLAVRDLKALGRSPLALTVTLLFAAGAASALAFFPRESAAGSSPAAPLQADQRSEFERWYEQQPRVPLAIPSDGARVLVVKFNDYQCPPCRQTYLSYKSVFAKYAAEQPGAVKFITRDYPLDSKCNPRVAGGGPHPAACEAAAAVRLARAKNRAEAMEEWLFANQASLTSPAVRQAAREVGEVTDFDQKVEATLELVKGDVQLGSQLGVKVTPTFFVNGVKLEGGLAPQFFEQAIAYELRRTQTPKP